VRGRRGSLEIPADTSLVIVEGTGASQRAHRDLVDATVWVQADVVVSGTGSVDPDADLIGIAPPPDGAR
jgi:hypothetical protein